MGIPAPTELILILAIVVFVFGAKRIPEIMDGIGKGIKTFKRSMESDDTPVPPQIAQPPPTQSAQDAKDHQLGEQKTEVR